MNVFISGECAVTGCTLDVELDILRWMTLMKHEDSYFNATFESCIYNLKRQVIGAGVWNDVQISLGSTDHIPLQCRTGRTRKGARFAFLLFFKTATNL